MTNEKLFDLTQELLERMEIAKKEAVGLEMNPSDSEFPFVHVGDKEYVNPKYLSFVDHCKIVQLGKFLREHSELKQEDLDKILSMCKTRFSVLIEVNNVVPNLVQEFRTHNEEKHVPYLYFGLKQIQRRENIVNV